MMVKSFSVVNVTWTDSDGDYDEVYVYSNIKEARTEYDYRKNEMIKFSGWAFHITSVELYSGALKLIQNAEVS